MRFALGSPRLGFSAHFWPPSSHIASELTFLLNSAGLLPPPQVVDSSLGCLSRCIPPLVVAELPSAPGQVQSSGQDKHAVTRRCAARRGQGNLARRLSLDGCVTKLRRSISRDSRDGLWTSLAGRRSIHRSLDLSC